VPAVRVQESASWRLDEIYRYTRDRWGEAQANGYITGLFEAFERIETHGVASKPVPAEFGVEGLYFRYERHFVYWRRLSNGDIGIVTILHDRMHQIERFREDFSGETEA
jgi:plasmid stabilization system protein ParE